MFEDPSLILALDFFRKNRCDIDWVKKQIYGENVVFVPETFPSEVISLDNIIRKVKDRRIMS